MKGKGNDGTGNVPERDKWETPQELWDKLNEQYCFSIDCCANEDNKKCERYYSIFEEGFELQLEKHVCWMNPPFSKAYEMFEHFFKVLNKGVAIYRCDNMETKVWQDVILKHASWVFIPKGRIKYEGFKGNSSRFPSALIGFNVKSPINLKGIIVKPEQVEK